MFDVARLLRVSEPSHPLDKSFEDFLAELDVLLAVLVHFWAVLRPIIPMAFGVLKTMSPSFKTMATRKTGIIQVRKNKSINSVSNACKATSKSCQVDAIVGEGVMTHEVNFFTTKFVKEPPNLLLAHKAMDFCLVKATGTHDPQLGGPQAVRFSVDVPVLVVVLGLREILQLPYFDMSCASLIVNLDLFFV